MSSPRFSTEIQAAVDHLFREQYRKIVASLTRVFGPDRLDLAESVVQDALIKAMQTWPTQGVPENSAGWILKVAKNGALDRIRQERLHDQKQAEITESFAALEGSESIDAAEAAHFNPLLREDQLRMIFTCCHPLIPREARVALTLKTLCGFGLEEIARAFLAKPDAIEQRITRAKQKIREAHLPYAIPEAHAIAERLESVLEVCYLLFNEGYGATEGNRLIREDLCEEAIRLTTMMAEYPPTAEPRVHALLALMHFQSSRFNARVDETGDLRLLSEQDRKRWDRAKISRGFQHLVLSARGDELTHYHLQASIAATHAAAPTYEATDWERILADYDELLKRDHGPVVALNRAVALGMARGAETAITVLLELQTLPPLKSYYLLPATLAEFYARLGDHAKASVHYSAALDLAKTEPERRFLLKKQAGLFERKSDERRHC